MRYMRPTSSHAQVSGMFFLLVFLCRLQHGNLLYIYCKCNCLFRRVSTWSKIIWHSWLQPQHLSGNQRSCKMGESLYLYSPHFVLSIKPKKGNKTMHRNLRRLVETVWEKMRRRLEVALFVQESTCFYSWQFVVLRWCLFCVESLFERVFSTEWFETSANFARSRTSWHSSFLECSFLFLLQSCISCRSWC